MSEIIIEWDRERLLVIQGQVVGRRVELSLAEELPRGENSEDTLEIVQRLRQLFPSGSDKRRLSATVVFPRQQVTVHRIQLPPVPDTEVPDLLKMQAALKLTVPVDTVAMDFTPLPMQSSAVTRDVLLVTVPNDQLALVRRTLGDAGLDLSEARVSGYCVAQLLESAGLLRESSEGTRVDIVAVMRADFLELTFLRGREVLFSHSGASWSAADAIERTLRSELSRARMSAADVLGDQQIGRIVLLGAHEITAAVTDQLSARFDGATIERVDPAVLVASAGDVLVTDMAAAAGALLSRQSSSVQTIDFVNPRRAPEKRDLRRVKVLGGALAAVVLFAGIWSYRQGRIADLTGQKSRWDADNAEIRERLQAGEKDLEWADKIGRWVDRDVEWLDEVDRLRQLMPGTDRMFVDNFTFSTVQQGGVGLMRFDAWAKSEAEINDFGRRLAEAGYRVKPYETDVRPAAVSQEYQIKVTMELVLPEGREDAGAAETAS
jgi:hypothetical protein